MSPGVFQQVADLLIADLGEILVPSTDADQRLRSHWADDLIRRRTQNLNRIWLPLGST
jgi:hypothetical protein